MSYYNDHLILLIYKFFNVISYILLPISSTNFKNYLISLCINLISLCDDIHDGMKLPE